MVPARVKGLAATALIVVAGGFLQAEAADAKYQAILVWGTDDVKPPEGKSYKPVDNDTKAKLHELPLKWKNFFEVNRTNFTVTPGLNRKVAVSEKCGLELKLLSSPGPELEVALVGKGKEVMRRKQALPKGQLLVLGGNAPNDTAWLVTLKRVE